MGIVIFSYLALVPLPNLYQDRLESLGDTVEVLKDVIRELKSPALMVLLSLFLILLMLLLLIYVNI